MSFSVPNLTPSDVGRSVFRCKESYFNAASGEFLNLNELGVVLGAHPGGGFTVRITSRVPQATIVVPLRSITIGAMVMRQPAPNPSGSSRNSAGSAPAPVRSSSSRYSLPAPNPSSSSRNSSGSAPAPNPILSSSSRHSLPATNLSGSQRISSGSAPAPIPPSPSNYTLMPTDVGKHMAMCVETYVNPANGQFMNRNDVGVALSYKTLADGTIEQVQLRITSRIPQVMIIIPFKFIKLGALVVIPLPVDYEGLLPARITSLPNPAKAPGSDLRRYAFAVLSGIAETKQRLPMLGQNVIRWLETPARLQETATLFNAGVLKCSPRLIPLLLRKDFTFQDIINVCPRVLRSNHSCGIYARFYSDFAPGSTFEGRDPYLYIGQAVNQADRLKGHDSATNDPEEVGIHYTVARAAKTCVVIQLCEIRSMEGGSNENGVGLRDICEQLFVLFFGTYRASVLQTQASDLSGTNLSAIAPAIVGDYRHRSLARAYTDIAKVALSKPEFDFALPGKENRQKAFGIHSGLNKLSPMGTGGQWEKTLWTMEDHENKWIFHKAGCVIAPSAHLFERGQLRILCPVKDGSVDLPAPGDTVYFSFECMKPTAGEHLVPYYRCQRIGIYKNWHFANKLAVKICWFSRTTRTWRTKYIQKGTDTSSSAAGREYHYRYGSGTALYAHLTRTHWEDKPDFVPDLGNADLMETRVDQFQQKIHTRITAGPLCRLPATTKSSPAAVRQKLKDMGYDNVDADWPSLQQAPKRGVSCDCCCIRDVACTRDGGTRHCVNCQALGLPCSWTSDEKLLGKPKRNGPVWEKSFGDFVALPRNALAGQAQIIPDPGFQKLSNNEA